MGAGAGKEAVGEEYLGCPIRDRDTLNGLNIMERTSGNEAALVRKLIVNREKKNLSEARAPDVDSGGNASVTKQK